VNRKEGRHKDCTDGNARKVLEMEMDSEEKEKKEEEELPGNFSNFSLSSFLKFSSSFNPFLPSLHFSVSLRPHYPSGYSTI